MDWGELATLALLWCAVMGGAGLLLLGWSLLKAGSKDGPKR